MSNIMLGVVLLLGLGMLLALFGWWRSALRSKELRSDVEFQARKYIQATQQAKSKHDESVRLQTALSMETKQHQRQQEALMIAKQALELLDVHLAKNQRKYLTPEERPRSQEILFQLHVDSHSEAAVLAAADGLPLLSTGEEEHSEGIAALQALLHKGAHAWAEALGGPWSTFSWGTIFFGMHMLSLQQEGRSLCIAGPAEAPWGSMRRAQLQLLGRPAVTASLQEPRIAEPQAEELVVYGQQSSYFSECLLDWHKRWDADAVAVFAGDGVPLATTEPYAQPLLGRMARYLIPLLKRAWSKGWDLTELSFRMSSSHKHMSLRVLEETPGGRFAIALSGRPVSERSMDALVRSLRWQLSEKQAQILQTNA